MRELRLAKLIAKDSCVTNRGLDFDYSDDTQLSFEDKPLKGITRNWTKSRIKTPVSQTTSHFELTMDEATEIKKPSQNRAYYPLLELPFENKHGKPKI